ncbi:MAG: hypothetical protein RLZZ360_835 [Candidatus Parcubacteria bacterium]|jgi:ribosomal protein S6--L-glutamate ligase
MDVLGINFSKEDAKLVLDIERVLVSAEASLRPLQASEMVLFLKNGAVTVFEQGTSINLKADWAILRGRGVQAHMTSLLVRLLKQAQVPIFGSSTGVEFTHNDGKITQMVDFTLHQLPIPHTYVFSKNSAKYVPAILENTSASYPLVLKKTGSKGSSVWKVDSWAEIESKLELVGWGDLFILQEFIPNHFDIRALYFNGRLLGAMARKSADGFYNNASKGADVEPITITDEEHALSLRACAVLGQGFAGVDIVRSERGPLFFEINNRPGYEGFERATGINVGEAITKIILADSK